MESRTIEFKGYTLTVYDNGDIYRHARTLIVKDGKLRKINGRMMTSSDNGSGYLKLGFKINGRIQKIRRFRNLKQFQSYK